MPFTNKRFIAILGILPFPIIKHISVNSQRTGYLWGFLALFGNHFNRLNLKRLVKPLHFDAFPNHWTPPILRAGFYANTNSSLCPLFRGKIRFNHLYGLYFSKFINFVFTVILVQEILKMRIIPTQFLNKVFYIHFLPHGQAEAVNPVILTADKIV